MTSPEDPAAVRRILVVDDEADVAATLARVLQACGVPSVAVCTRYVELQPALHELRPDVVLTDLLMPDASGLDVLREVHAHDARTPVVVVSAHASLDNAVKVVKAGAFDFLSKPFDPDTVELLLEKLRREFRGRHEAAAWRQRMSLEDPYLLPLVGLSPAMTALRHRVLRLRPVQASVLVEGETGTGKELVARALHAGRGPFVAVNVAAIPADMAESELFGHRSGAFTGAVRERSGLLAEADQGTLFLDEVNAMPLALQAKLLRALETRRVRAVGAERDRPVEFRLIAAANEPLERAVEQGRFRRDLLHRIRVAHVQLPPLRDRLEDLPLLVETFLAHQSRVHNRNIRRVAPELLELLRLRSWPGNVRELENLVEQMVIFSPDGHDELGVEALQTASGDAVDPAADAGEGQPLSLAAVEARYVRTVLRMTRGNKTQAARLLGIDYKTLLRKIREPGA